MGGSESGYLAMQVQTAYIQAGSIITGIIHFHLQAHLRAQSLALKLSGKERASWVEQRGSDSDGSANYVTYEGKRKFITAILPVFLFQGGQIAPGDYSFPFSMGTSASLPGTFHYRKADTRADLQYTLTAFLQGSDTKVKKAKTEVVVMTYMAQAIVGVKELGLARVSTWCCSSQGEVRLGAVFNKNAYVPGETAVVGVEVDNSQSKLAVVRVNVGLFCTIRLRSNTGATNTTKAKLNESGSAQGVAAGQSATGPSALQLSVAIISAQQDLQRTTTLRSQFIECIFTLEVKAQMDGSCMCCGQTPAVQQEVCIYPMQLPPVALPQMPPGWNPTVMPAVQFAEVQSYNYYPTAPSS